MANPQVFYTSVGIVKEATWGVDAVPTIWLPASNPNFQPGDMQHIDDDGLRGKASANYDLIPGPGNGKFGWGGNLYLDTVPAILSSIVGPDVVAGAGPYTHTMQLSPTPDSYTIEEQQNVSAYHYNGGRFTEFVLSWDSSSGTANYTVQGVSKIGLEMTGGAGQGGGALPAFTAESAISSVAGWQGAITIAGAATANLISGSVTFSRPATIKHGWSNIAGGSQDARAIYPLALDVTGRLLFDYTQTTEQYYASPRSGAAGTNLASGTVVKNALVLTLRRSATEVLQITLTKAAYKMAERQTADGVYQLALSFRAVHNATDVGPVSVVTTNNRAAVY